MSQKLYTTKQYDEKLRYIIKGLRAKFTSGDDTNENYQAICDDIADELEDQFKLRGKKK